MLSENKVLDAAANYDFAAVQAYLEQGGRTDIYDGYGSSLLTSLLKGYYRCAFYIGPDGKQIDIEADENKNAIYDSWAPLEQRPHPIKKQIDYLISKGIGINNIGWEEAKQHQHSDSDYEVDTPLYYTVVNRDYCMTKYLLDLGADPDIKFSFEDERFDSDYWLLEDLDIAILNGDREEAMENDLRIAALLMRYGNGQWPGGHCIDVDQESRTIRGHSPYLKF